MQLFDRLQTPDELLNRIQDRIKAVLNAALRKPIIDGILSDNITVTTSTPYALNHGLGRIPQGYIICGQNSSGIVYEYTASYPNFTRDDKALFLIASGSDVTCRVWVF